MTNSSPKVLIYSHDSFGLGHLRRCRTIAHALTRRFTDMSVLILSGSPIIGSFEFRSRVDFVRIPGVIKLRNGEYTPLSLSLNIEHILAIRTSIIEHTAKIFDPDILIVDKEPLGLRGEILGTLEMLKQRGNTRLVLGLRDVMDDPTVLREEWTRKNVDPALEALYDEIWVYGPPDLHNPLDGMGLPASVHAKTLNTGYLRRDVPDDARITEPLPFDDEPYILVTPGGGGDGVEMVDWVMRAYESRAQPLFPALIVLGPFMPAQATADFQARAEHLRDVHILRFLPTIEPYMAGAKAIVGMGGYNTFCEILSFDKPTLLVPRVVPRREQSIRATRAETIGLLKVLPIDEYPDVDKMTDALAELPWMEPPSTAGVDNLLGGLDVIGDRVERILADRPAVSRPLTAVNAV
ncbi:glycosyltransferase family protein [Stappia sp.]|uniref:glycosyltransferase family protein n=1 Tax=Stappia sp. TaxID=1870903 RepID=UPI003A98D54A